MSNKRGRLFVISAPAGTGKTTLVSRLTAEHDSVVETVSSTTRPPRPGETDGVHYHFLTDDEFAKHLEAGDFLEHADVFGFHYGTSRLEVEKLLDDGKQVILVIDVQGAVQIKAKMQSTTIFLSPPSMEELRRRLCQRNTERPEAIERRLQRAPSELSHLHEYDHHILNDDLETAYQELCAIVLNR